MFKQLRIPKGWRYLALEDFLIPTLRQIKKPNQGYKKLGIRSHGKGTFVTNIENPKNISMDFLYEVKKDDLIVNITFAWEGAVAIVKETDEDALVSHRFPTYTFNKKTVIPSYFRYVILSKHFYYLLGTISPGGAGRNRVLSKKDFLKLRVLIPPLPEQKKIVEILGVWDDSIHLNSKLIKCKRELKFGLMQNLMMNNKLSSNKGEWTRRKLGDLLDIKYGKSPKAVKEEGGKYLIYGTGGILGSTDSPLSDGPAIIIGRKGTITKPIFTNKPFWAIDTTFYGKPKEKINMLWLYYAVTKLNFEKYNEGSAIPSLSRNTLHNITIDIPSIKKQEKTAAILKQCDFEIDILSRRLNIIIQQKTSLIQKLLTGQIRVKV